MGHDKKGGGEDGTITVVLNVDLHCEGCAEKLKKSVEGFDGNLLLISLDPSRSALVRFVRPWNVYNCTGVERVKADIGDGKLTVVGKVDPSKLRDRVAAKTHKEVDLVSPTKTVKKGAGDSEKPPAEKDSNECYWTTCTVHGVSTVVLKTRIHCDDCSKRIRRMICNIKGVRWVMVDAQKGLVTVKGTMDVQELPEVLKRKLNQQVDTVPPKKDDGGEKKDEGGDKKGKGGEKERSGKKETVVGGGGGGGGRMNDGGKAEANRMEYYAGYTYGIEKENGGQKETVAGGGGGGGWKDDGGKAEANRTEYSAGYTYRIEMVHAPELFSDENPNACSVM
uniref:Heavy metal-associated isoprenylated plant protein 3 isoform X2 n=1 Tax=Elaeis guineensis var. tenera TaxID=51953 RepID=A0A8N4IHE9_ELAGV|nr:heavy metal-associated isoprenylated plant protein 3 isoform X2 [Elaeis guineensis]